MLRLPFDNQKVKGNYAIFFKKYRENRRLHALLDLFTVYDGNSHRQMTNICLIASAGNDHFMDLYRVDQFSI